MRFVRPVYALLAVLLSLAGALAWLWLDPRGHLRPILWQPPATVVPDVQAPANLGKVALADAAGSTSQILERPLFAPDRRPPPPPKPPPPPPPPDPLADFKVQGIVTGDAGGVLAWLNGKVRRFKLNESVGQWKLTTIEGRRVTFTDGAQTRQFDLAFARLDTPKPAPPPPVAMQAPGAAPVPGAGGSLVDRAQMEARERQRRVNEMLAIKGLPPQ